MTNVSFNHLGQHTHTLTHTHSHTQTEHTWRSCGRNQRAALLSVYLSSCPGPVLTFPHGNISPSLLFLPSLCLPLLVFPITSIPPTPPPAAVCISTLYHSLWLGKLFFPSPDFSLRALLSSPRKKLIFF